MPSRMELLQRIQLRGQAAKVEGYLVDIQTANLLVEAHKIGNENTKKVIETYPLPEVVTTAWKAAKKA